MRFFSRLSPCGIRFGLRPTKARLVESHGGPLGFHHSSMRSRGAFSPSRAAGTMIHRSTSPPFAGRPGAQSDRRFRCGRNHRATRATGHVNERVAHLAFQRLCGFSCRDPGDGGTMRGHVTAATIGFVGPVFLLALPSSSHAATFERIRVRHSCPRHVGAPGAARIPLAGVGLLTRSLARHRLSEFSPHHFACGGSDQGERNAAH